jgi:hypothetical protein
LVSEQVVSLQKVCPLAHWQLLAWQVRPPLQLVPHAPQLAASEVKSTQPELHALLPVAHAQAPLVHASPDWQG